MKKGLEIRLYPSKEQRVLIDRTLGCSRFVYNHVLAIKKELWEDYKLSFNPNLKSFKEDWNKKKSGVAAPRLRINGIMRILEKINIMMNTML